jgi:hypothetical protein
LSITSDALLLPYRHGMRIYGVHAGHLPFFEWSSVNAASIFVSSNWFAGWYFDFH